MIFLLLSRYLTFAQGRSCWSQRSSEFDLVPPILEVEAHSRSLPVPGKVKKIVINYSYCVLQSEGMRGIVATPFSQVMRASRPTATAKAEVAAVAAAGADW